MLDGKEFLLRVNGLDDDDRNHFREVIETLIRCYGDKKDGTAVVVFSPDDSMMVQALTINCNDMDAYKLIRNVSEYFHFVNTQDAPPREKFN